MCQYAFYTQKQFKSLYCISCRHSSKKKNREDLTCNYNIWPFNLIYAQISFLVWNVFSLNMPIRLYIYIIKCQFREKFGRRIFSQIYPQRNSLVLRWFTRAVLSRVLFRVRRRNSSRPAAHPVAVEHQRETCPLHTMLSCPSDSNMIAYATREVHVNTRGPSSYIWKLIGRFTTETK